MTSSNIERVEYNNNNNIEEYKIRTLQSIQYILLHICICITEYKHHIIPKNIQICIGVCSRTQ